ncbi:glycine cleavage T-C-terminal barrel domain protein [Rickettsia felis str. Pedreira]|uniref:Glycine cleavage T-C-terminal barrel domain protein n=2 Tax=Rickettsia felis TaxID=42862 RepID=A0A0F3MUY1_RICFI|nr:folate-binding protein YgfZ [Rickettsia felis]AAY61662.1 Glycine cleavage T-protein [Rickettsia felis URRWXCal2]KHO03020.1 aminomethyltransferase [Rickettsia felis str. LSU]KJV59257.1 glycine cleavage T-C-terminal barrel domain protein [Rickettsia felis str. Pedreira]MDE8610947.1 folate-binding protein YgfZ [Rickettsia felis]
MYEILSNREIIKIIGLDSVKFLQNLVTNDICKSSYCYTYLLNNQGRYLFDFFVYVHKLEEIYLDIDKSNKAALIEYLNFYKFRSKIQIIDCSEEYKIVYSHQKLDIDTLVTSRDPRYSMLGFRSILSSRGLTTGSRNTGKQDWIPWSSHGMTIYLEDKYNFAIIDGVEDLITDKSIPNMYGAEELNAISFDKGCYVGQEVISRAKYQGVIRRKIYKITADEDLSSLVKDEEILADNDKIGVICTSYRNKAIALIREEKYLACKKSDITVKGIKINLSLAPWY